MLPERVPAIGDAQQIAEALQVLAEPLRLRALLLLLDREQTAGELAATLGVRPNLLSYHLAALREVGLAACQTDEADRRARRYSANQAALAQLGRALSGLAAEAAGQPADRSPLGVDQLLADMARTADGFFVVDGEHRIQLWNANAEKLLGYRAGDVLGQRCEAVLAGRSADGQLICRAPCRPMELLAGGRPPASYLLVARQRVGAPRCLQVSLIPLPGGLVAHIFHDAERQGQLEQFAAQLQQSVARLVAGGVDGPPPPSPAGPRPPRLTAREREVLLLLADGLTTDAIAARLVVGRSTARKHVQSLLSKLGARSRLEAVARATRLGLLSPAPSAGEA